MASTQLTNRFIAGLKKHKLTYDEMKDWKYCGGQMREHHNYFRLCFGAVAFPSQRSKCVCGQDIKENCYITPKIPEDRILVLGNCCIKKFIPDSKRTCELCGKSHQNRKDNLCSECRPAHIKKCCDLCGDHHKNRKDNLCNDCRSGIIKRNCANCGIRHKNTIVNRCDVCRSGVCDLCDKKIDIKYKKCYRCYMK